jgi:hypothetical protein
MAEVRGPGEEWDRIRDSQFGSLYLCELAAIADRARSLCAEVFAGADAPPPGKSYMKVDRVLHAKITTAVVEAARVKSLVHPASRQSRESVASFAFRIARCAWLREDVLAGVALPTVLQTTARHSVEHFDEYLDKTARRSLAGRIPRPTLIPADMVLSDAGALDSLHIGGATPTIERLRVFYAKERIFVNAGVTLDLGALHDELRAIVDRVLPLFPPGQDPRVGAQMLVITDRSFRGPG